MTELLQQVVNRVRQLPDSEQDAIAAMILDELEDEARWDAAFAASPDVLSQLAAEAEEDISRLPSCWPARR